MVCGMLHNEKFFCCFKYLISEDWNVFCSYSPLMSYTSDIVIKNCKNRGISIQCPFTIPKKGENKSVKQNTSSRTNALQQHKLSHHKCFSISFWGFMRVSKLNWAECDGELGLQSARTIWQEATLRRKKAFLITLQKVDPPLRIVLISNFHPDRQYCIMKWSLWHHIRCSLHEEMCPERICMEPDGSAITQTWPIQ